MQPFLLRIVVSGLALFVLGSNLSRAQKYNPDAEAQAKAGDWIHLLAVDANKKIFHYDPSDKVNTSRKVIGGFYPSRYYAKKDCHTDVVTFFESNDTMQPNLQNDPAGAAPKQHSCGQVNINIGSFVEPGNAGTAVRHLRTFIEALDNFSTRADMCDTKRIWTTTPGQDATALRSSMRSVAQFPKMFDGGLQEKSGFVSLKGGILKNSVVAEVTCSTGGEFATCALTTTGHTRSDCRKYGQFADAPEKSAEKLLSSVGTPDFGTGSAKPSASAPPPPPAPIAPDAPKADAAPPSNTSTPFGGKPFGE